MKVKLIETLTEPIFCYSASVIANGCDHLSLLADYFSKKNLIITEEDLVKM